MKLNITFISTNRPLVRSHRPRCTPSERLQHPEGLYFFKLIDCMEHLVINWTVMILGSLVALIGGAIGLKLASRMGQRVDEKSFSNRLGYLNDENAELKKYLKSVKGSMSQMKQGLTIDGDGVEEINDGNFDGVIKGLIGKYQHLCPPQFRFLLNDPAIVSFLLEEAKKHPEQTKDVLKHFIGKNGNVGKESGSDESKQADLEQYAEGGA